ncbi:MAG: phosphodiester glycosidase family protein [Akkermansiaceae bacterium]|nr:phosphodiester glycosidase family protein [Akkermansiaceae bacterium]
MTFRRKIPLFFPLIALLGSCSVSIPRAQTPAPTEPPAPVAPPVTPPKTAIPAVTPKISPPTLSPSPKHPLKVRSASLNSTAFTAVTFDRRDFFLKVIDQKGGPGSQFDNAEAAGKGSLATINGSFFNPDGSPLGLVIAGGESRGAFNSSSFLGSGILDGKALTLATRKTYQKSSELLQAGPRLVWDGKVVTGLSTNNDRPRSFVIWDGADHFGIAYADTATLQGLSNNLRSQPLKGFNIKYALNLDGGTSCDLWISHSVPGGGIAKNSFFLKKARNYLALRKR